MNIKNQLLIDKGVIFENYNSVYISDDVKVENIKPGAKICSGVSIKGKKTFIAENSVIGSEGPVTVNNCIIDKDVQLGSGFFESSVFLRGFKSGSNAHVRKGCIFEENSSIAHSAGTKQTILFPYVTLGSLVNFCDCMMTGGTSSKNHSEVGSSFIHFNFTPNQDKATASIMGNVYKGVFLDMAPIFLGGQGGMVGPCRIEFGNVSAAGSILRRDELRKNRLIMEYVHKNINIEQKKETYSSISRILKNNIFYMANLIALKNWYQYFKIGFLEEPVIKFTLETLDVCISERIKRIDQLSTKVADGAKNHGSGKLLELKLNFCTNIEKIKSKIHSFIESDIHVQAREAFLKSVIGTEKSDYLDTIHSMNLPQKESGTIWLESIVKSFIKDLGQILDKFELTDS